jgi:hypothetical protein
MYVLPTQRATPLSKYPALQGQVFVDNVLKFAELHVKQVVTVPEQVVHA